MLIDQLRYADKYANLHPGFAQAFDFLSSAPLATLAAGRYPIDGDNVFASVQDYTTKELEQGFWEAHRRFIDVQFVVSGTERIGYAPLDSLTMTQPYDETRDLVMLAGKGDFVTATAGTFAVFYPHDAHMPGIALGALSPVRKVVVKVAVQ